MIVNLSKTPEIYCAISISFDKKIAIESIITQLQQINIVEYSVCNPTNSSVFNIDIAIVKNEPFWYLDDALTKMFSYVDNCIGKLKSIILSFNGETCIDIAFYQYGTYPALEFFGTNMKKIHFLDASIRIDPY